MPEERLSWRPILVLVCLFMTWGANMAAIKLAALEISPLFMAGLRSLVAAVCLGVWIRVKGIPFFPGLSVFGHGVVCGLLFGLQFACIFVGLKYTLASRSYVLVYTTPFFVAIGAHFFLKDDRLTLSKMIGLVMAFTGVLLIFIRDFEKLSLDTLTGDLLALAGAAFWGATTVYLKKYLAPKTHPLQTLFYQLFFSAPFLFLFSFLWEDVFISGFSGLTAVSLFFQCIIVAFLSLLVWFHLIHKYPVSLLHGFSFFTPVFGVLLSGILILGEKVPTQLFISLALVSMGMIFVNRPPRRG